MEEFRKYLKSTWSKLTSLQRIVLVAAPLVVAITLLLLINWANKPEYVRLFEKLSDTQAGAIKTKLQELKVTYQLADNGSTILVTKQQAAEVKLDLANAGLPQGSKFSFDSINELHLGETDADRKLRYVLGLQNQIETTLATLDGVQDARVHITIPEDTLFTENQKIATAAATLKLKPGTQIEETEVRAVANLIAASVEGLQPENVTIVSTDGSVLSDLIGKKNDPKRLTGDQIQMQQTVETGIEKSVKSMLEGVFGTGNIVVRANVTLNFDQVKIVKQVNGPGALVSRQSSNEAVNNSSPSSSATAAPTNLQSAAGPYVYSSPSNNTSTKSVSTENYQVDTTQEETMVSPGTIKRLTVSVMADSNGGIAQSQIKDIESSVALAVGFDQARNDKIFVSVLPFNKSGLQDVNKAIAAAESAKKNMTYAKLGAAVLLALILLLIIWRSRSSRRASEQVGTADLGDTEDMFAGMQMAKEEDAATLEHVKSAEELEKQQIKETIDKFSKDNPEEVARLVKSWLTEEK